MQKSVLIQIDGATLEALIFDAVDRAIKLNQAELSTSRSSSEYIDLKGLLQECLPGLPESSARQKIARGEIPGVTKVGKRLVFHKPTVDQWLKDNRRTSREAAMEAAEIQFNTNHNRRGGRKAA